MPNNTVKLITRVDGNVEAIRKELGVVTDNYNALTNKPSINGVELRGNVNLETLKILEPAGPSVYVYIGNAGSAKTLRPDQLNLFTDGREIQLGDLIFTLDKKVFYVDGFEIFDGPEDSEFYTASLLWDLA